MSELPKPTGYPSRQNVTFPSADTTAHGYVLALPPSGSGPGVIVIQEWWGLTDHIADVTDRLAQEGFVALAPDLYGGNVAHESEEALRMKLALPVPTGVELLSGAVDYLLARPEVASATVRSVGFCMGGGFVLYQAAADPRVSAAVPFYGMIEGELPDFSGLRAEVLGHYGERGREHPGGEAGPAARGHQGAVRHHRRPACLSGRPRLLQRLPPGVRRRVGGPGVGEHGAVPQGAGALTAGVLNTGDLTWRRAGPGDAFPGPPRPFRSCTSVPAALVSAAGRRATRWR